MEGANYSCGASAADLLGWWLWLSQRGEFQGRGLGVMSGEWISV